MDSASGGPVDQSPRLSVRVQVQESQAKDTSGHIYNLSVLPHRKEQSHSFTQGVRLGSDFCSNNQERFFTSSPLRLTGLLLALIHRQSGN